MTRLKVCDGDKPIYGITLECMVQIRIVMTYGLPFDCAMQYLKRLYEYNKALSERPINFHDNI